MAAISQGTAWTSSSRALSGSWLPNPFDLFLAACATSTVPFTSYTAMQDYPERRTYPIRH